MILEDLIILELKSVEALTPVHSKQLLNYLRLSGLKVSLLLNFNTISLKDQLVRLVSQYSEKLLFPPFNSVRK